MVFLLKFWTSATAMYKMCIARIFWQFYKIILASTKLLPTFLLRIYSQKYSELQEGEGSLQEDVIHTFPIRKTFFG